MRPRPAIAALAALVIVVCCVPSTSGQNLTASADCAVFEALWANSVANKTVPWTPGVCCGYYVGKNYVVCTGTRITQILLTRLGFQGQIPSLASLDALEVLYMPDNYFTGTLPALSTLTSLTNVDLSDNDIGGSIPSLTALKKLTQLNLANNMLSGAFPDLSGLTALTRLDLHGNQLTGNVDGMAPSSLTTCLLSFNSSNPGLYSCGGNLNANCASDVVRGGVTCPASTTAGTGVVAKTGTAAASGTNPAGTNSAISTTGKTDSIAQIGVIAGGAMAVISGAVAGVAIFMLCRRRGRQVRRPSPSREIKMKPSPTSSRGPPNLTGPTPYPASSPPSYTSNPPSQAGNGYAQLPPNGNGNGYPPQPASEPQVYEASGAYGAGAGSRGIQQQQFDQGPPRSDTRSPPQPMTPSDPVPPNRSARGQRSPPNHRQPSQGGQAGYAQPASLPPQQGSQDAYPGGYDPAPMPPTRARSPPTNASRSMSPARPPQSSRRSRHEGSAGGGAAARARSQSPSRAMHSRKQSGHVEGGHAKRQSGYDQSGQGQGRSQRYGAAPAEGQGGQDTWGGQF